MVLVIDKVFFYSDSVHFYLRVASCLENTIRQTKVNPVSARLQYPLDCFDVRHDVVSRVDEEDSGNAVPRVCRENTLHCTLGLSHLANGYFKEIYLHFSERSLEQHWMGNGRKTLL